MSGIAADPIDAVGEGIPVRCDRKLHFVLYPDRIEVLCGRCTRHAQLTGGAWPVYHRYDKATGNEIVGESCTHLVQFSHGNTEKMRNL